MSFEATSVDTLAIFESGEVEVFCPQDREVYWVFALTLTPLVSNHICVSAIWAEILPVTLIGRSF